MRTSPPHLLRDTFVPIRWQRRGAKRVADDLRPIHDTTLLAGLARGFYWQSLITRGVMRGARDIAEAEGLHFTVVTEHLRLTLLAPRIIEMLLAGQ